MKQYFAFEVNEYRYKRVPFSVHKTLLAAEKKAHRNSRRFRQGEMPTSADVTPMVFSGREEFLKWAEESYYVVDWENKTLIFDEVKWQNS